MGYTEYDIMGFRVYSGIPFPIMMLGELIAGLHILGQVIGVFILMVVFPYIYYKAIREYIEKKKWAKWMISPFWGTLWAACYPMLGICCLYWYYTV